MRIRAVHTNAHGIYGMGDWGRVDVPTALKITKTVIYILPPFPSK